MKMLLSHNLKFILDDMFITNRPVIKVIDTITNNGQGFLEFIFQDDVNSYYLYKWYCMEYPRCIDLVYVKDAYKLPIIIGVDEL